MKTKNMFWAALSMTAALVMTACSSDNDVTEKPAAPQAQKIIPYTVTVSDAAASGAAAPTRATVSDDPTDRQLFFAEGDKLYITGTNIQGVLSLQAGDAGKSEGATFSGELTYTGSGSPADGLGLTATLISAQQTEGTHFSVDAAGAVTVNYPTTVCCSSVNDAVQQYSQLTSTSTYGERSFTLSQLTAFLNFVITLDDGTAANTALSTVVSNNGSNICTSSVTTESEGGKVVAKFVLPIEGGTTLISPTVTMGNKPAISFSGATLSPKVYNVKKSYNKFSVGAKKSVYFSKGNLQATTSNLGTTWTWAFAENPWDKVGNAAANTSITANKTVSTNGTVDLFGWSTDETYLGINKTNNNNAEFEGTFQDWGKHADVIAGIGEGWRTLTGAEWDYLFTDRSTTSGISFCKAKVGDCFGVILLPDSWDNNYYSLVDYNETTPRNFDDTNIHNKITLADWRSKFEANGAVFLPCAGQRSSGNVVTAPNGQVHYWSATLGTTPTGSSANANHVRVDGSVVYPNTGAGRSNGFSVRLVKDVQ